MGLQGALVDLARPVEKRAAGGRVEGRTVYADVVGEWFRCRLQLPSATETPDQATQKPQVTVVPTLMYGAVDTTGVAVRLTNAQRLEVASPELGTALWDVVSEPEPMRKKRRVIGWQAQLRRVEQHPADEAVLV